MAEKSIRVPEGSSGEYIATRDGHENDDGANARTVQMMDFAHRQLDFVFGTPTRDNVYGGGDWNDSPILTSLPADITSNKITMGDKSTLVVMGAFSNSSASTGNLVITPLVLDASNNILGMLWPKSFSGYDPVGSTAALYYVESGKDMIVTPARTWEVHGAVYIGLHVMVDKFGTSGTLDTYKVWGSAISSPEGVGFPDQSNSDFYAATASKQSS